MIKCDYGVHYPVTIWHLLAALITTFHSIQRPNISHKMSYYQRQIPLALTALLIFNALTTTTAIMSINLIGESLTVVYETGHNWKWCSFEHLGKKCRFNWNPDNKSTVESDNSCYDFANGTLAFYNDYNAKQCGIRLTGVKKSEMVGEWTCEMGYYINSHPRGGLQTLGHSRNFTIKYAAPNSGQLMSSNSNTSIQCPSYLATTLILIFTSISQKFRF